MALKKRSAPLSLPRIAVVLDENTSQDATRYESPKSLFRSLTDVGAYPLALPYLPEHVDALADEFDALVSPGGRFAFPAEWYGGFAPSYAPTSERGTFEIALMSRFLDLGKPVLGICNGMQILAGLAGAKLIGDVRKAGEAILPHNGDNVSHSVDVAPGTRLHAMTGGGSFEVNSLHNEAVMEVAPGLKASAYAPDGTIEAVELQGHSFAIGVQWHQERYQGEDHPANAIFRAFIEAI